MSRAADTTLVVLDFETTGTVDGWPSEPWQLGMVRLRKGRVAGDEMYEHLLQVGDRPFNPRAPGNHHTRRAELAAAPRLEELWPELRDWWLGSPLVAHNVSTERKIVRAAAPLHKPGPWIDTLKLARCAYPEFASHGLSDLVSHLDLVTRVEALCPGREPHDALYDAVASAVFLEHLLGDADWSALRVDDLVAAHPTSFYRSVQEARPRYRVRKPSAG